MADPYQSAQTVLGVALRYARGGSNLARAAMAGAREMVALEHYPRHDVVDPLHRSRFFYHAHHARKQPREEHGHFHVFHDVGTPGDFSHLVGISLDARGWPLRLFTTNRWVTGERWRSAAELEPLLAAFRVETEGRQAPVARWVSAMLRLYERPIGQLLRRRDAMLLRRSRQADWASVMEDRRLDVVSQLRVSLPHRIQSLGC